MGLSKFFSTLAWFSFQIISTSFLKLTSTSTPDPLITIWNYVAITLTNLKWAFEALLYNQFSFSWPSHYDIPKTGPDEFFRITRYDRHHMDDNSADEVCAVCLGKVDEGEEIGELRCSHVFHQRCLEGWARLEHVTCPLCRGPLAAPPPLTAGGRAVGDFGSVEVLFFKFCSFGSNDNERESWWLR